VTFLRHLAAVVLVVAVIVGLGLLWAHVSGGGGPGGGFRPSPSGAALQRIKDGAVSVPSGTDFHPSRPRLSAFDLGNSGVLIQTGEIEVALAAVVITVSVIRRRHRRRMRRAATASGRSLRRRAGR
jgi:hypothetical protein